MNEDRILIVGGGIGGLALALFLNKIGRSCTLYEAHGRNETGGAGFVIAPNGMRVLASLELAETAVARGCPAVENRFYNAHGKLLAAYPNGDVSRHQWPPVSLMREDLIALMREAAEARGVDMRFGRVVADVCEAADSVTLTFADGTRDAGSILVGADGIHSRVRRSIFPEAPGPEFTGFVGVGGVVSLSEMRPMSIAQRQTLHFTFGAKGFFGYVGARDGDLMWWSLLPRPYPLSPSELAALDHETIVREALSIYGDYHSPVPDLIRGTIRAVRLNVHDIASLPRWHSTRAILIGDAAHAVSPNTGQGASLALEDAMLLASLLRDHSLAPCIAFERFVGARRKRVEEIVAAGRRMSQQKTIAGPFKQKIREFALSLILGMFGEKMLEPLFSYTIPWDGRP